MKVGQNKHLSGERKENKINERKVKGKYHMPSKFKRQCNWTCDINKKKIIIVGVLLTIK